MYRAKREGKGCYRVFEAAMHTAAVERMSLEQELRAAIRDGALTVYYQPIIDTDTGQVSPRSRHSLGGTTRPEASCRPIPSFHLPKTRASFIELGRAVLLEACRQARQWHAAFPDLRPERLGQRSRLQLANPGFVDHVADALALANLDPSSLTIEVTESILASSPGM